MLVVVACGDDDEEPAGAGAGHPVAAPPTAPAPLLDQQGDLAASDPSDSRGRYDRYFVDVQPNERLQIALTSDAFDPTLEVTPPESGTLSNDDWEGDTTRSQLELVTGAAGSMKIEVRSYRADGHGAYHLTVRRVSGRERGEVPLLTAGQSIEGALAEGDHALSNGDVFDSYVVQASGPLRITVGGVGGDAPRTTLVGPDGLTLDERGDHYEAPDSGAYRLQVIGHPGARYRVRVASEDGTGAPLLARAHHQFDRIVDQLATVTGGGGGSTASPANAPNPTSAPTDPDAVSAPTPLPVRAGNRIHGNLATTDPHLASGELYDVYELSVAAPAGDVSVELESTAFDTFVRVEGPGGQRWENDDDGGTLNSRVDVPLSAPGTYRIVVTSYRAGDTGPYELKVTRNAPGAGHRFRGDPERRAAGRLAAPGRRHALERRVLRRVPLHLAGRRAHPPRGALDALRHLPDRASAERAAAGQRRHDAGAGHGRGAGLAGDQAGEWRVAVTSYRSGETGDYTLVVRGAPAGGVAQPSQSGQPGPQPNPSQPNPSAPSPPRPNAPPSAGDRTENGSLAQGDRHPRQRRVHRQLRDDVHAPERGVHPARPRATSIPTSSCTRPAGEQQDNDDFASGHLEQRHRHPGRGAGDLPRHRHQLPCRARPGAIG